MFLDTHRKLASRMRVLFEGEEEVLDFRDVKVELRLGFFLSFFCVWIPAGGGFSSYKV